MKKIVYTALIATFVILNGFNYPAGIKIAKLKYNGGGDWYANKTSLINLIDGKASVGQIDLNPIYQRNVV